MQVEGEERNDENPNTFNSLQDPLHADSNGEHDSNLADISPSGAIIVQLRLPGYIGTVHERCRVYVSEVRTNAVVVYL